MSIIPPTSSTTPVNPNGDLKPTGYTLPNITQDFLSGWVPLLDILQTVGTARNKNQQAQFEAIQNQIQILFNNYKMLSEQSNLLAALFNSLQTQAQGQQTTLQKQTLLNSQITTYNNNVASARTTLNAAIGAYNAGGPISAYQAAITAFNNAIAGFNTTYTSEANLYNTYLTTIAPPTTLPNAPTALSFTTPSSTATPPVTTIGLQQLAQVTLIVPVNVNTYVNQNFPLQAAPIISGISDLNQQQALQIGLININNEAASSGDITLPAAYITASPQLVVNSNPGGVGSSVGGISFALGGSSPVVLTVMGDAVFKSILTEQQLNDNPNLIDNLLAVSFELINGAAQAAATPTVQQLAENTNEKNAGALSVASTQAFADKIRQLTSSNIINDTIRALLEQQKGLSNAQLDALTASLSAALKIGLINVALNQYSAILALPGLTSQVLSNVDGTPPRSEILAQKESDKVANVLNNPISVLFLKDKLAKDLVTSGTPLTVAQTIVSQTLNSLISNVYTSVAAFQTAFSDALQKQSIDKKQADKSAQLAADYVSQQNLLPPLDTKVNTDALASLQAQLTSPGSTSTAAPGTTQRALIDQLVHESQTDPAVQGALTSVGSQSFSTNREYYSALYNQLLTNGVSGQKAQNIANLAVKLTSPQTEGSSPLFNSKSLTKLSVSNLSEEINNYINSHLALDPFSAKTLSDQVVKTLVSSNSLLSQYNAQVSILQQQKQDRAFKQVFDQIPTVSNPSVPVNSQVVNVNAVILKTISRWQNPADQTSIMNQDNAKMPTNFKRSLDFTV